MIRAPALVTFLRTRSLTVNSLTSDETMFEASLKHSCPSAPSVNKDRVSSCVSFRGLRNPAQADAQGGENIDAYDIKGAPPGSDWIIQRFNRRMRLVWCHQKASVAAVCHCSVLVWLNSRSSVDISQPTSLQKDGGDLHRPRLCVYFGILIR